MPSAQDLVTPGLWTILPIPQLMLMGTAWFSDSGELCLIISTDLTCLTRIPFSIAKPAAQ